MTEVFPYEDHPCWEFVTSELPRHCANCGEETHRVEICFEAYLCSTLCVREMEHGYFLALAKEPE